MAGFENEMKIGSRLRTSASSYPKIGYNPSSVLDEQANEQYDVEIKYNIVELEVQGVVQTVSGNSIWEM